MGIEQAYYFSVALINLVFAFAGTQIKETEQHSNSIVYFIISFFAYFVSWFIYVFEVGTTLEMFSALCSTLFVWGMVLFACQRTSTKIPWPIIVGIFSLNCAAQMYFIVHANLTYYLHVSGLFLPIAFWSISYMFLKLKPKKYPSDRIIGYAYLIMALIILARSFLMELSPELFARSSMYSQIIWPAFCAVVGVFILLSYTEEAQSKLEKESNTDQLTGIFNRRLFDIKLKNILADLTVTENFGALIYLDLDGFKPINDKYGHYVGDQVLIELASRLNALCKANDVVSRLGGDEFAMLTTNIKSTPLDAKRQILELAQTIQQEIKKPVNSHGLTLQVDCSIGIHILTSVSQSPQIALLAADNAMYHSKNTQRGNITFSDNSSKPKYSIVKTGIDEIDHDHNDIDLLIQSMMADHNNFDNLLPVLAERLAHHFKNEVILCETRGLNMTNEHVNQHNKILDLVHGFLERDNKDSIPNVLDSIYNSIENHTLEFDTALIKMSKDQSPNTK